MTTRPLPLFPLPLVIFPATTLPLHIFEPRYRALIADCRQGDGRFGIVVTSGGDERALPAGTVGCEAELRDVQTLPDGRANVLVRGTRRFAFERFVEAPQLYHVATVSDYDDEPEEAGASLRDEAERVRATFARVARAARMIADDDAPPPELPDDDALLAFHVASLVDFDRADRQALLVSRSPLERLRMVDGLLTRALQGVEERAATHTRARGNGHGPPGAFGAT